MPFSITNNQNSKRIDNAFLVKKFGKGNIVFCGLSLPTQIAAGEASAYKLLANIIALSAKNKK